MHAFSPLIHVVECLDGHHRRVACRCRIVVPGKKRALNLTPLRAPHGEAIDRVFFAVFPVDIIIIIIIIILTFIILKFVN